MFCRLNCALHARSLGGGDATSKRKTLNDLGHPGRRVTDLLLVLNVAMFGLQSYYNPGIIMWGAKVTSLCAVVQAGGRRHTSSLANLRIPKRGGLAADVR